MTETHKVYIHKTRISLETSGKHHKYFTYCSSHFIIKIITETKHQHLLYMVSKPQELYEANSEVVFL